MTTNKAKIALITGSSRGLGKSTALNLAKKGVDVMVTYHSNAAEATNVVTEIESLGAKAVAIQLDSSSVKTFDSFMAQVKQSLQDKWQTDTTEGSLRSDIFIHLWIIADSTATEICFDRPRSYHIYGNFSRSQLLSHV